MHDSDHFYTELNAIQRRNRSQSGAREQNEADAESGFSRLVSPVIGPEASHELFLLWQDRYGALAEPRYEALGHIAAFILGDYDDATMDLDREDWKSIAESISTQADNLDIDTLTNLMSALLDRGALT